MTTRDYASHTIPAPIIKDPLTTVEDVAGSLTTTATLMRSMQASIEGLQDIARRDPATVSPDAWKARLETMDALSSAIDQRMNDDIAILYAVIAVEQSKQTL